MGAEKSKEFLEAITPVLDVCCGSKMFYFDKDSKDVTFMDIRGGVATYLCDGRKFEVNPDVVADFTDIPYADGSFKMVVFDPPHLLRRKSRDVMNVDIEYGTLTNRVEPTGYQQIKYGCLYEDWKDMLRKGFKECFRVLESGGFLIFKWNETDIPVSEVLKLTEETPLFGNRSGKLSKTHWICFMKR